MKNFRNLNVWKKSHTLTMKMYKQTKKFPRDETYGLTSQIRRSAVSIPTNIAEGCGRGSDSDFKRFLQIAMGSASELEYLILLSHDLQMLDDESYEIASNEAVEIKKMLSSLINKIKADI